MHLYRILNLLIIMAMSVTVVFGSEKVRIDRVNISNNKRVPESRVSQYMVKPGDLFDLEEINESIKLLHSTGYFSEIAVSADMQGNDFVLTYIVQEQPLVALVDFLGDDDSKLPEIVTVKKDELFNLSKVSYSMQVIKSHYQKKGYADVHVTYSLQYKNQSSVIVIFEIQLGKKSRIYNIWFYGNDSFTDEELRTQLKSREKEFWSIITSSGNLEQGLLELDIQSIGTFYRSKGFLNVEVSQPEITTQRDRADRMDYVMRVKEGIKYNLGDISYVDASGLLTPEEIKDATVLRQGDVFDLTQFRDDIDSILELYTSKGYARAYIDDAISLNDILQSAQVTLTVFPGDIYEIDKIVVTGNSKTYDNVIRREFDIVEGDIFNSVLLEEAKANLYSTGFFDSVDFKYEYGYKTVVVVVDIVEKEKLASLSFSASYNTLDYLSGKVDFSVNNVMGTGRKVSFSVEAGNRRRSFEINFDDPWVFDQPYSLGLSLYHTERQYSDYDRKSFGGEISIGRQIIKRRLFGNLSMGHSESNIFDISSSASDYIKNRRGSSIQNYLTPSLVYSHLDNNVDPRQGFRAEVYGQYSGTFLGGNVHMIRGNLDLSYHHKLPSSFVASIHGEIGQLWALKKYGIPVDRRFYLGGIYSVRGFDYRTISPRDDKGEVYGGDKFYQVNLELWRPILDGNISVRGVLFFDMGMVYDEGQKFFTIAPRKAAGFGVRMLTPMGLIRMEYGHKLDRRDGESAGQFEFSIGSIF